MKKQMKDIQEFEFMFTYDQIVQKLLSKITSLFRAEFKEIEKRIDED